MPPENLHVTLVFLGDINPRQQMQLSQGAETIQTGPFSLNLNQMGYWPKQQIAFLGADAIPDELQDLVSQLKSLVRKTGLRVEQRAYQPHITLARRCEQPPATPILSPAFDLHFDSFDLVESQRHKTGARYQSLNAWPL